MNDPNPSTRPGPALEALPGFEPPADAWARIEARLDAGPRIARARAGLALVALLVVAFGLRFGLAPQRAAAPPAAGAGARTALQAPPLDQRAAELERLLAALPAQRVTRASTGYATSLLEDRIALLDERLGLSDGSDLSPQAALELKKQRLVLLDSLVRVKYASAVAATL